MVQQNQYGGLAHKDPNVHLATFLEICDTIKMNGATQDVIRIRLFPFLLRGRLEGGFSIYSQEALVLGRS